LPGPPAIPLRLELENPVLQRLTRDVAPRPQQMHKPRVRTVRTRQIPRFNQQPTVHHLRPRPDGFARGSMLQGLEDRTHRLVVPDQPVESSSPTDPATMPFPQRVL